MEVMPDEWVTSKELAKTIAKKYPEDFRKPPYRGDLSAFSMALGPSLYALANQGRIKHDGTKWPAIKRWRRVEPKEQISVDEVAEALTKLHLATDKNQGIRMLAARIVRERPEEFAELVREASKVSEESMKIGRKILGV